MSSLQLSPCMRPESLTYKAGSIRPQAQNAPQPHNRVSCSCMLVDGKSEQHPAFFHSSKYWFLIQNTGLFFSILFQTNITFFTILSGIQHHDSNMSVLLLTGSWEPTNPTLRENHPQSLCTSLSDCQGNTQWATIRLQHHDSNMSVSCHYWQFAGITLGNPHLSLSQPIICTF